MATPLRSSDKAAWARIFVRGPIQCQNARAHKDVKVSDHYPITASLRLDEALLLDPVAVDFGCGVGADCGKYLSSKACLVDGFSDGLLILFVDQRR
jgi:hypothetical protein